MQDTANLSTELIQQDRPEVLAIIQVLTNRALSSLKNSQISNIRASSVELNGIYGLYQEQLIQGIQDIHWLCDWNVLSDEIIYIFEEKSELITIPRLPIAIDLTVIEPYKVPLASMGVGVELSIDDTQGVPEALIYVLDNAGILSTWGRLIWGECKQDILAQELLQFPQLKFRDSFKADYKAISQKHEWIKMQETLAKVSHLLTKFNGTTGGLQGGALQYTRYRNSNRIDYFRVDLSQRISCESLGDELLLRHYGSHAHVEGRVL